MLTRKRSYLCRSGIFYRPTRFGCVSVLLRCVLMASVGIEIDNAFEVSSEHAA